jgi:hypothetical protein
VFETTAIVTIYRHELLTDDQALLVGFDLLGMDGEHPDLLAGACTRPSGDLPYSYGRAIRQGVASAQPSLPERAADGEAEFVYDRRRWVAGAQAEDVAWLVEKLGAGLQRLAGVQMPR